jgi:glucan phosphoethanolaminetransferase (alkaline phosphatase superfamily)
MFVETYDNLIIKAFLLILVGLYIITLIYIQFSDYIKSTKKLLFYAKIYSSAFSILFAIFAIYNLIFIENFQDIASKLIPFLLFLFGIYELFTNENPNKVEEFDEIDQIGQKN